MQAYKNVNLIVNKFKIVKTFINAKPKGVSTLLKVLKISTIPKLVKKL